MNENRFVIISPMFEASKTLPRMLHSILGQSYENWRLILIDDLSGEDHYHRSKEILQNFRCLDGRDRIEAIWNVTKKWEVENVLQGLARCDDEDIVVRIDPDDFLTDLDAFRIVNDAYEKTGCEIAWSAHRWHDDEKVTDFNISGPMPPNADPYTHPWVSSHLKTFRKRLLNNVKDENYRRWDGKYFTRIGDQTFTLPALRSTTKRLFIPRVLYSYRCDMKPTTFQTDDAKLQKAEADFLRQRGFVQ